MTDFKKGITYALISAVSGAYLYIFSKYVLHFINPETFCGIYYFFATIYFVIYFIASGKVNLLKIARSSLKIVLSIGILESLSALTLFSAVHLMDPTLVSFFNNSQTIFIILFSAVFLNERFNKVEGIGTFVALGGIFLISYHSAHPVILGMLLTLLSAFFFSCTVMVVKKNLSNISPLTLAFYRAFFLVVLLNLYATGGGFYVTKLKLEWILAIAAGALFGPFLNILFYFFSMRYFEASKTSLIRASQPLFVLINSALLLHIIPGAKEIMGGIIIIIGLWILVKGHESASAKAVTSATSRR